MIRVLAPHCPDCGAVAVHPLRMARPCPDCIGIVPDCKTCGGKRMVILPPPTDEQIFGRACDLCEGKGRYSRWQEGVYAPTECRQCNGTGRVCAAENRWVCFGSTYRVYGYSGPDPHPDEGCVLRDKTCPGRSDIVADEALWAEVKRAWRTRTKTTVLRGILGTSHEAMLVTHHAPGHPEAVRTRLYDVVDVGSEGHVGTWTISVAFEPEDP